MSPYKVYPDGTSSAQMTRLNSNTDLTERTKKQLKGGNKKMMNNNYMDPNQLLGTVSSNSR